MQNCKDYNHCFYNPLAGKWHCSLLVSKSALVFVDQYNNKAVMCQALNGLRRESDDMLVMQTFAKFTKSLWGNDFGMLL